MTTDFLVSCRRAPDETDPEGATPATLALVRGGAGSWVCFVRRGATPDDLVYAARMVLENALEWLAEAVDDGAGQGTQDLHDNVESALDFLPDSLDEDDADRGNRQC